MKLDKVQLHRFFDDSNYRDEVLQNSYNGNLEGFLAVTTDEDKELRKNEVFKTMNSRMAARQSQADQLKFYGRYIPEDQLSATIEHDYDKMMFQFNMKNSVGDTPELDFEYIKQKQDKLPDIVKLDDVWWSPREIAAGATAGVVDSYLGTLTGLTGIAYGGWNVANQFDRIQKIQDDPVWGEFYNKQKDAFKQINIDILNKTEEIKAEQIKPDADLDKILQLSSELKSLYDQQREIEYKTNKTLQNFQVLNPTWLYETTQRAQGNLRSVMKAQHNANEAILRIGDVSDEERSNFLFQLSQVTGQLSGILLTGAVGGLGKTAIVKSLDKSISKFVNKEYQKAMREQVTKILKIGITQQHPGVTGKLFLSYGQRHHGSMAAAAMDDVFLVSYFTKHTDDLKSLLHSFDPRKYTTKVIDDGINNMGSKKFANFVLKNKKFRDHIQRSIKSDMDLKDMRGWNIISEAKADPRLWGKFRTIADDIVEDINKKFGKKVPDDLMEMIETTPISAKAKQLSNEALRKLGVTDEVINELPFIRSEAISGYFSKWSVKNFSRKTRLSLFKMDKAVMDNLHVIQLGGIVFQEQLRNHLGKLGVDMETATDEQLNEAVGSAFMYTVPALLLEKIGINRIFREADRLGKGTQSAGQLLSTTSKAGTEGVNVSALKRGLNTAKNYVETGLVEGSTEYSQALLGDLISSFVSEHPGTDFTGEEFAMHLRDFALGFFAGTMAEGAVHAATSSGLSQWVTKNVVGGNFTTDGRFLVGELDIAQVEVLREIHPELEPILDTPPSEWTPEQHQIFEDFIGKAPEVKLEPLEVVKDEYGEIVRDVEGKPKLTGTLTLDPTLIEDVTTLLDPTQTILETITVPITRGITIAATAKKPFSILTSNTIQGQTTDVFSPVSTEGRLIIDTQTLNTAVLSSVFGRGSETMNNLITALIKGTFDTEVDSVKKILLGKDAEGKTKEQAEAEFEDFISEFVPSWAVQKGLTKRIARELGEAARRGETKIIERLAQATGISKETLIDLMAKPEKYSIDITIDKAAEEYDSADTVTKNKAKALLQLVDLAKFSDDVSINDIVGSTEEVLSKFFTEKEISQIGEGDFSIINEKIKLSDKNLHKQWLFKVKAISTLFKVKRAEGAVSASDIEQIVKEAEKLDDVIFGTGEDIFGIADTIRLSLPKEMFSKLNHPAKIKKYKESIKKDWLDDATMDDTNKIINVINATMNGDFLGGISGELRGEFLTIFGSRARKFLGSQTKHFETFKEGAKTGNVGLMIQGVLGVIMMRKVILPAISKFIGAIFGAITFKKDEDKEKFFEFLNNTPEGLIMKLELGGMILSAHDDWIKTNPENTDLDSNAITSNFVKQFFKSFDVDVELEKEGVIGYIRIEEPEVEEEE